MRSVSADLTDQLEFPKDKEARLGKAGPNQSGTWSEKEV